MLMGALMAAVWYIPGWLRTQTPQTGVIESISNTFDQATVEFKSWNGDIPIWQKSTATADAEAKRFVDEIAAMDEAARTNLTIVGHSLGGRITVHVLAGLAERKLKIRQGIILAAAIPYDDPDLKTMGSGSILPVVSVCNPDDVTLRWVFTVIGAEPVAAYGANGTTQVPENVKEYVTPTNITHQIEIDAAWAKSQTLKEIANHHALFYLEYMRRILGGEEPSDEVMVPQHYVTLEWPVIDAGIWWDVADEFDGWKLERNKVTGHFRILDPKKVRTAWGREAEMRAAFEKVKAQLKSWR